jgi:acyl-CoA reductase-like NAD-dependent aldehyde dehydrogenase
VSAAADFIERRDLFIGGGFQPSRSGATLDVHSSSTEAAIGRVPDASTADIDAAVAAARAAFDSGPFPRWSPKERGEAIAKLSNAL